MFRRNLVPIWVAVLVLSSIYLMGQGWGPEESVPPAPVPKTGQTTSYATGDDGDLQMGIASPSPRFTDNGNGTVTDNLTGLIWTKDAGCGGSKTWSDAVNYCNILVDGGCTLSDGSILGDWRLPNIRELLSLVDYGNDDPALPTGHPFLNVQSSTSYFYWASSTGATQNIDAWGVLFYWGTDTGAAKTSLHGVWCVRGGQ